MIAAVSNEEEIAPSRGGRNTHRRGESSCGHPVTSEPKRRSQKVAGTEEGLLHDKDLERPQRQPAGPSLADQRGQKEACPEEESPDRHHSIEEEKEKNPLGEREPDPPRRIAWVGCGAEKLEGDTPRRAAA